MIWFMRPLRQRNASGIKSSGKSSSRVGPASSRHTTVVTGAGLSDLLVECGWRLSLSLSHSSGVHLKYTHPVLCLATAAEIHGITLWARACRFLFHLPRQPNLVMQDIIHRHHYYTEFAEFPVSRTLRFGFSQRWRMIESL